MRSRGKRGREVARRKRADDIGGDQLPGQRRAGDALLQQPHGVERALAMSRDDKRPTAIFVRNVIVEGTQHIVIGKLQRLD